VVELRKGFLMMSDALFSFLIISSSIVIIHQLIIETPSYSRQYLYTVTSDAATLIEESSGNRINDILNESPENICLQSMIKDYETMSEQVVTKTGCTTPTGEITVSQRTLVEDDYYLITVKGWWS
jgi:hypothetical protein